MVTDNMMAMAVKIAGAQMDMVVGDIAGNEAKIVEVMSWAQEEGADILLVPELALVGYPPEDLVFRTDFVQANLQALDRLAQQSEDMITVVGFVDFVAEVPVNRFAPWQRDSVHRQVANGAALLRGGEIAGIYHKVLLPNYGVFDEARYFRVGENPEGVWDFGELSVGVSICEDIWSPSGPPLRQAEAGANLLVNINASPYHRAKVGEREQMLVERARAAHTPLAYLNLVGAQDELVFDGGSMVISGSGEVIHHSPLFTEDRFVVSIEIGDPSAVLANRNWVLPKADEELFSALVCGLAGYVRKNGFPGVVIGLSGGIDSALTAAIAKEALGGENVWGVAMPSRYSSEHSIADAKTLASNLGIRFSQISIDDIFAVFLGDLAAEFSGTEPGVTEENIQARIRGTLLMALSNKFGSMVLATGNKSELAVGYATLYGDMAGGFSVLKDVFKTQVYDLARWYNREREFIPWFTIEKPPSAELAPDQLDSDSLPPYEVLDPILELYIEEDTEPNLIVDRGFGQELVDKIIQMVDGNEYKRRQSAPGVKVTTKAFGKDRRLPITNHYRP